MKADNYDGQKDAEHILENIMRRRNWSVDARDQIAAALVKIRLGHNLTRGPKRIKNRTNARPA